MTARVVSWKFCENCGRHGNIHVPGLPPSPQIVEKSYGRELLKALREASFISRDEEKSLLSDLERSKLPEHVSPLLPLQFLVAILSSLEGDAPNAMAERAKLN